MQDVSHWSILKYSDWVHTKWFRFVMTSIEIKRPKKRSYKWIPHWHPCKLHKADCKPHVSVFTSFRDYTAWSTFSTNILNSITIQWQRHMNPQRNAAECVKTSQVRSSCALWQEAVDRNGNTGGSLWISGTTFFPVRVAEHQHGLPRRGCRVPILGDAQKPSGRGPGLYVSLLEHGGWTRWHPEVPSNPNQPVTLRPPLC